jgi:murein L,D-transpeptidase YafK
VVDPNLRLLLGGLSSLRTLSLGLSLAATLLLVALALAVPHAGSQALPRDLDLRVAENGSTTGSPILIRIFKQESELELWMRKDDRFQLFATYSICFWSGKLGPKEHEGDRQAPEGFYAVGTGQLRLGGRHPRSFNIGFPNALDRALGRTGSYIMVHGGCTSIGCFAMTDPVMQEIYQLSDLALRHGQDQIQVHIFPFRMTDSNLTAQVSSKWYGFWRNLKEGYDAFEVSQVPPTIGVCRTQYVINAAAFANQSSPISVDSDACGPETPIITSSHAGPKPHVLAKRRMATSRLPGRGSVRAAGIHVVSQRPRMATRAGQRARRL